MADIFDNTKRSEIMAAIKGQNTKPELTVRKTLHSLGFRYRLYDEKLAGKPDIVLKKYSVAVFVNGCFWHGHNCKKGKLPTSNIDFWKEKITKNKNRDRKNIVLLEKAGWKVFVLWQCELKEKLDELTNYLLCKRDELKFLNSQ